MGIEKHQLFKFPATREPIYVLAQMISVDLPYTDSESLSILSYEPQVNSR